MSARNPQDKFVAMATAKASVDLPLSEFQPVSMLTVPEHRVDRPAVAAIDAHNHLDDFEPAEVLPVMDACRVERIVNITMRPGLDGLAILDRFRPHRDRFSVMAWMDWRGVTEDGFWQRSVETLERLVERGACGIKLWKDLGLSVRDASGDLLRIDDERLAPLFEKAAELRVPVMFHTADPDAFFLPIDGRNERFEELAAHPDWAFANAQYGKNELLEQRDRVFLRHPRTQFLAAHVGECAGELAKIAAVLDRCPNVAVDMSARVAELGRQPFTARRFFLQYADRILFGMDLFPEAETYRLHFRFFETEDEYFDYPSHASRQGRWKVYGLHLPPDVLAKIYRDNALRWLPLQ